MENFWFYIKLGLQHVLDLGAYDHILFLAALAVPFTFKSWKKVVLLASVFTIFHCLSLVLSVYNFFTIKVHLIEFLIPVTIVVTAIFNLWYSKIDTKKGNITIHAIATTIFGLIHGFGFSNYFKMLMSGEEEKLSPLVGFAAGIEISQLVIVLCVLILGYLITKFLKIKQSIFVVVVSVLIVLITIPLLISTFPF